MDTGILLRRTFFYAFLPFVQTQTVFWVAEKRPFAKLLPGWRYSESLFSVLMCRQGKLSFWHVTSESAPYLLCLMSECVPLSPLFTATSNTHNTDHTASTASFGQDPVVHLVGGTILRTKWWFLKYGKIIFLRQGHRSCLWVSCFAHTLK